MPHRPSFLLSVFRVMFCKVCRQIVVFDNMLELLFKKATRSRDVVNFENVSYKRSNFQRSLKNDQHIVVFSKTLVSYDEHFE